MAHWLVELVTGTANLVIGVLLVSKVHDHFYPRQNVAHIYLGGDRRPAEDSSKTQSDSDKDE
jgi:hypothetical protein